MRKNLILTTTLLTLVTAIPNYSYAESEKHFITNNNEISAPDIQYRFIDVIKKYQIESPEQWNDVQKRLIYKKRGKDLKSLNFSGDVQNWVGNVKRISTFGDDVFLRIEIAHDIILFVSADIEDEIVEKISPLQDGQQIIFSGKLKPDSSAGFDEVSFTTDGGLTEPEFKFTLTDIQTLN